MEILLALGGGGVKGAAHLGVMRVLEREGFIIKGIAGSSAGAMIGAFYCAGHSIDEIQDRLIHLEQNHLYQRRAGDRPAFLGLSGIATLIESFVGQTAFEDLEIPLIITATNLHTGQGVIFQRGSVLDAVLASIAVPGLFPVQIVQDSPLVDGGVINPVPVRAARSLAPDLPVVAVVLSPAHKDWHGLMERRGMFASIPLIGNLAERLVWAQALEVFMHGVDIAGLLFTDLQLRLERPEVLLRPELHNVGLIDKVDVEKIIMAGEMVAFESLPGIRAAAQENSVRKMITRRLAGWINRHYPTLLDEMLRQENGS